MTDPDPVLSTDEPCYDPETPPDETPPDETPPDETPPDETPPADEPVPRMPRTDDPPVRQFAMPSAEPEGPVVEVPTLPATPPVVDPADSGETTPSHVATLLLRLKDFSQHADGRSSAGEARLALNYLDVFGYLKKELAGWTDISLGDVINALTSFQEFFGLKTTGQLDTKTVRAMEGQRCGHPDHVREDTPAGIQYMKVKQFAATNLPRWKRTAIKYAVQDYVPGLGKSEQDQIFDAAFQTWEDVAEINVSRVGPGESPDIVIGIGQGQRSNFDGPGGTLAWAYLPSGDDSQLQMRFDVDETWLGLSGTGRGIFLANVAAHEFGHLLGLDHSRVQTALMAPYYDPKVTKPQANDDIPRVQARYGPRTSPVDPVDPPPPPPPPTGTKRIEIVVSGTATVTVDGKVVA